MRKKEHKRRILETKKLAYLSERLEAGRDSAGSQATAARGSVFLLRPATPLPG